MAYQAADDRYASMTFRRAGHSGVLLPAAVLPSRALTDGRVEGSRCASSADNGVASAPVALQGRPAG
jgi:hypothetical protein